MVKKICLSFFLVILFTSAALGILAFSVIQKLCTRKIPKTAYLQNSIHKKNKIITKHSAQPVSFMSSDGIQLHGLFIERPQANRAVVLCHGYHNSKEEMRAFIKLFPNDTILLFDFRAHGESSGTFITIGHHEKHDVLAAVDFLRNQKQITGKIIGFGCSMGAATLLAAQAEEKVFDALILDSSFDALHKQVARVFERKAGLPKMPIMPIAALLFEHIAQVPLHGIWPVQHAKKVQCPTLVIHSQHDAFTPVGCAYKIFSALSTSQKMVYIAPCNGHVKAIEKCREEYFFMVKIFLDSIPT